MSGTFKTRLYSVAKEDPRNQQYRIVRSDGKWGPWFWKPITSCKSSRCCYKDWHARDRKKERIKVRQKLRSQPID